MLRMLLFWTMIALKVGTRGVPYVAASIFITMVSGDYSAAREVNATAMDRNVGSSQSSGSAYHQQLRFSLADMGVVRSNLNPSTACHVSTAVTTPLVALSSHLRPSHAPLSSVHLPRPNTFLAAPSPIPTMRGESNMVSSSVGIVRASSSSAAVLASRMDLYHVNPGMPGGALNSSHLASSSYVGGSGSGSGAAHIMNSAALQVQMPFQKLKVEDALSYLDQVKLQFANKPHVYNDFLEIMKDFKAQSVDTPGVIQRVSQLFRGHPNLIVGFNTFLPPGYKIEVHGDRGERVSICTPNGQSHIIAGEDEPSTSSIKTYLNVPVCTENRQQPSPCGKNQPPSQSSSTVQPMEFNHAINYVNKIKLRFQTQPEVYKQFLEILHTYQKEQRELKEGRIPIGQSPLTEAEVYAMVARLFVNEADLLREFGQFLPDASSATTQIHVQQQQQQQQLQQQQQQQTAENAARQAIKMTASSDAAIVAMTDHPKPSTSTDSGNVDEEPVCSSSSSASSAVVERLVASQIEKQNETEATKDAEVASASSSKVIPISLDDDDAAVEGMSIRKITYDVSIEEAAKYATFAEYQFFDKVRKALRKEEPYLNFLRCLVLFNIKIVTKRELLQLAQHFLGRFPELIKWFKDFMDGTEETTDSVPAKKEQEGISSDLAMEIDFASCKRYGISYRALPPSYKKPHCSGRKPEDLQVLNDTWVSFPSWQSEDSSNVAQKKTQFEEWMYRTEDERFELDIVIEVNRSTIQVFENVLKRMSHMSTEEAKRFQLDDTLGGTSMTIHQRAISRVYGDCASDVIEGCKRNPYVAVPIVLKRLKEKDDEWREAQKNFDHIWREQNQKYYWKSLDHQGITFKQNDLKVVRSKALISQIEALYDERHEAIEQQAGEIPTGPHLEVTYPEERTVFCDVHDLLIHHVKRQTSIQSEEKRKIKRILKTILPRLFGIKAKENDSEEDTNQADADGLSDESDTGASVIEIPMKRRRMSADGTDGSESHRISDSGGASVKDLHPLYSGHCLIFLPNPWYVFLRLHQLFCERLSMLFNRAATILMESNCDTDIDDTTGEHPISDALACGCKSQPSPAKFYPSLIRLIKSLLDGQIDGGQYEDSLREMFTIHAYIAFTFDKMVQIMVKQLHAMVTDPVCIDALELHNKWMWEARSKDYFIAGVRSRLEEAYQREAEKIMANLNCFKIYFWYQSRKVTFEMLDTDLNAQSLEVVKGMKWSAYVENYLSLVTPTETEQLTEKFLIRMNQKPLFVFRNLKRLASLTRNDGESSAELSKSGGCTTAKGPENDDHIDSDENGNKSPKSNGGESSVHAAVAIFNRFRKFNHENAVKTMLTGMFVAENLQARFNRSIHRWQYIAGTEDVLCRRTRPTAAAASTETAGGRTLGGSCANVDLPHWYTTMKYDYYRLWFMFMSSYAYRVSILMNGTGALGQGTFQRFLKQTEKRNSAFAHFHEQWTLNNLTMEQVHRTADWFMGRLDDGSTVWMQRIQVPCPIRAPYFLCNKYIVDRSKNALNATQDLAFMPTNHGR
ncbi:unnamed protein product [Soboliphyme baturini]|uniref:Paired amphipathic helix protein Sin3b n=1 Tax=Soboliphyme baturini TaxID=241478 RepID=A0A183IDC5_9BILA|nr:unnamed protein product [Soboliphyme baturini]